MLKQNGRNRILSLALFAIVAAGVYLYRDIRSTQAEGALNLSEPALMTKARSAEDQTAVQAIADEAGIAAYYDSGSAIDLTNAKTAFRTIEAETASYIIGSVGVTDYDENHDVHVYVDSSGWIMAYYDDAEPASKIFDWRLYDGGAEVPTTLDTVLSLVASTSGVSVQAATYYHFNYPNATHLLLVTELASDLTTDSFIINLPSTQNYYERSWSMGKFSRFSTTTTFSVNDDEIFAQPNSSGWHFEEGVLTPSQLGISSDHELEIRHSGSSSSANDELGYLGLAIVYEVP